MKKSLAFLLCVAFIRSTSPAIGGDALHAASVRTVSQEEGTSTRSVYHGNLQVPPGYAFYMLGVDSSAGTLVRTNDGFTVSFDIGYMAGVRMSRAKESECLVFRQHCLNGRYCSTGILSINGTRRVVTSFSDLRIRADILSSEAERLEKLLAPPALISSKRKEEELIHAELLLARRSQERGKAPANFWADIRNDVDLLDFFVIVSSYVPWDKSVAETSVDERQR